MQGALDDLVQLVALAGPIADGRRASQRGRKRPIAAVSDLADPLADAVVEQLEQAEPERDDLLAMVAAGLVEQPKVYIQRGWQLTEKARAAKKSKALSAELTIAKSAQMVAETAVRAIASQFPVVARAAGLSVHCESGMGPLRSALVQRLAFMPPIRGDSFAKTSQREAVALVASCGMELQRVFFRAQFLEPRNPVLFDDVLGPLQHANVIRCLTWQWDETSQRIRALAKGRLKGERTSHCRVAVQIMMQGGRVSVFEGHGANVKDTHNNVFDEQHMSCYEHKL
jgi:hypothetical protein